MNIWQLAGLFLLVGVGLYIVITGVLFAFQSKLVYVPRRRLDSTPDQAGLHFEDVWLRTSDGVDIHGWFVPAEDSSWYLLFCHGNAGNISHRLESLEIFHQLGLNSLIFDYRGYGQSSGAPSENGTHLDALAAWRWLVEEKRVPPQRIVLFGQSLGGAVAARLASETQPGALIVESAFTSIKELGAELYSLVPVKLLSLYSYNTAGYLQSVRCPVLVIHSRQDCLIPFWHGERLYSLAREPKEFLEIIGDHNRGFLNSGERYIQGIDKFIRKHVE